jgi:DNA repair exonuclease SbcCD ATPase subunit
MDYRLGLTGITGRNGAGKSNLGGAAQYFAITGKTYDRSKSELLHWDAARGRTEFEFKLGDEDLTLMRSVNSGTVRLTSESGKVDLSGAEANLFMTDALGAPPDVILNTCWVLQGDLGRILKMTDMERVKFFQGLAGVQQAEKIRKTILTAVNRIPTYEDNTEEIDRLNEAIPKHKELVGNLSDRSEKLTTLLDGHSGPYKEQLAILGLKPSEDMEQDLKMANDLLTSEQEELKSFTESHTELLEGHTDPPDALSGEEFGAIAALQRIPGLVEKKDEAQEAVDKFDPDLIPEKEENYAKLVQVKKDLDKVYEQAKMLTDKECPTCKRPYELTWDENIQCGKDQERLELEESELQELHDEALEAEAAVLILSKAEDELQTQMDIAGPYVLNELNDKHAARQAWEKSTEERKTAVQALERKKDNIRECEKKLAALEAVPTMKSTRN